jgi:hypothetical protein
VTFDQALGIVAALAAYFPRSRIADETRTAWAAALAEHDVLDGLAAANALGRSSRFLPALAELLDETRRAQAARIGSVPALPEQLPEPYPFALFLAEHPEIKSRLLALQGTLFGAVFAEILRGEIASARRQ